MGTSSFSHIFERVKSSQGKKQSQSRRRNGGQNPNQVGSFADESLPLEADDESPTEQSQIDSADSSSGTRTPALFPPVVFESTELAPFPS